MTDVQQIGGRRGATLAAAAVFVTILVAGTLVRADPAAIELTPGPQDGIAYRLGKRSLFRITAVNRSAAPQQVRASTRLRGSSLAAQSRDLWLPPKSRRTAWHPLYLPDDLPGASRLVEAETVYAERAGEDQPWSESAPGSASASLLSLETDRVVTALLYDGQDDTIRQLVVDARRTQNLSDRLTLLRTDALPTMAEWLECYDQMVLATDQLANDPAGLVAIRHWLESGGRLWIMLDQAPAAWVAPLVGDDFGITLVDRVRVAGGIVKDVRDVPRKADGPRRRFSEPIDLARIIADDISVDFEIDGWPAALRQRVGRGSILYTTLGREAWSSGTAPAAKRPASAVGPLEILASDFFQPRSETQNLPAAETVAASMIGYKILGRGAVAAILGANGLAIVALGVLPAARRRRHGMAGVAVAVALASSCVIVGLGAATRRAVNPTLSSVQLVHVIPERGEMHVRGVTDAYLPTAVAQGMSGADCALAGDGLLLSGRGALHWLDDRRWRLNKPLPTGLSLMRLSWREPLHEKRVVSATLAEEGIVGTLNGRLFAEAETAILAAPGALPLAVRIAADGHFQAGAVDRLEAGQFAAAGLLDERTTRRQRMYRQLFAPPGNGSALGLSGPTLLFWNNPMSPPVSIGGPMQTVGEALTAVAISLMPPSPGASFAIPSVFLPFEAVDGPDGTPATSAYSNARRSWVDGMVTASQITLRFQTPKSLAPLAIEKATLHVEISAPSRVVTLAGWQGEVATPLQRVTSPVGRLTAAIPDARMLGLDSTGGLRVNINVGSHPREQEANISKVGWSVQNVWLDIDAARTSPR